MCNYRYSRYVPYIKISHTQQASKHSPYTHVYKHLSLAASLLLLPSSLPPFSIYTFISRREREREVIIAKPKIREVKESEYKLLKVSEGRVYLGKVE